jgi:hypothetical protein
MSFIEAFGHKRAAAKNNQNGRPACNQPNLADLFRLRRMDKIMQQANKEIEQLKERIRRLEDALALRSKPVAACDDVRQPCPPSTPPLPIAELRELAAMARRFK